MIVISDSGEHEMRTGDDRCWKHVYCDLDNPCAGPLCLGCECCEWECICDDELDS